MYGGSKIAFYCGIHKQNHYSDFAEDKDNAGYCQSVQMSCVGH